MNSCLFIGRFQPLHDGHLGVIKELPSLAFDHKTILDYAFQRLKWKLEYSNIVARIMPEKFTLTELQKTYEIILNKELDKRNFRKKIASLQLLKKLKEKKMDGAHRPAQLYMFNDKSFKAQGYPIVLS